MKIRKLKEERVRKSFDVTPGRNNKKEELKFHVGLKKKMKHNFTLVTTQHGGGIRKLTLSKSMTYKPVVEKLVEEFQIDKDVYNVYLVGKGNDILPETFTVASYASTYSYVGALRLYLLIEEKDFIDEDSDQENVQLLKTVTSHDIIKDKDVDIPVVEQKVEQNIAHEQREHLMDKDSVLENVQQLKTVTSHDIIKDKDVDIPVVEQKVEQNIAHEQREHPQSFVERDQRKHSRLSVAEGQNILNYSQPQKDVSVTIEDVDKYFLEEVLEEISDKADATYAGDLVKYSTTKFTPLHTRSPCVQYFMDDMKNRGKQYAIAMSGWGEFVVLPNEDFSQFLKFKENLKGKEFMECISPALQYFRGLYKHDMKMIPISKSVVMLDDAFLKAYREWTVQMKEKVRRSLK